MAEWLETTTNLHAFSVVISAVCACCVCMPVYTVGVPEWLLAMQARICPLSTLSSHVCFLVRNGLGT